MDLFNSSEIMLPIPLEDGALALLGQLPLGHSNEAVLGRLIAETPWRAETVKVWGRQYPQPRLSAWYGTAAYTYSGLTLLPLPFTPLLLEIKEAVEAVTGTHFNSVLLNYYRNERDSMGMHSDDEPELGTNPVIASLSFGAARTFILKHKRTGQRFTLCLNNGSLLLMSDATQKNWLHGINKENSPRGPRVNLTFRFIF